MLSKLDYQILPIQIRPVRKTGLILLSRHAAAGIQRQGAEARSSAPSQTGFNAETPRSAEKRRGNEFSVQLCEALRLGVKPPQLGSPLGDP